MFNILRINIYLCAGLGVASVGGGAAAALYYKVNLKAQFNNITKEQQLLNDLESTKIAAEKELKKATENLEQIEKVIKQHNSQIEQLTKDKEQKQSEIKQKNIDIDNKKQEIEAKKQEIPLHIEEEIQLSRSLIHDLINEMTEIVEVINYINAQLDDNPTDPQKLQKERSDLTQDITNLNQNKEHEAQYIQQLHKQKTNLYAYIIPGIREDDFENKIKISINELNKLTEQQLELNKELIALITETKDLEATIQTETKNKGYTIDQESYIKTYKETQEKNVEKATEDYNNAKIQFENKQKDLEAKNKQESSK